MTKLEHSLESQNLKVILDVIIFLLDSIIHYKNCLNFPERCTFVVLDLGVSGIKKSFIVARCGPNQFPKW